MGMDELVEDYGTEAIMKHENEVAECFLRISQWMAKNEGRVGRLAVLGRNIFSTEWEFHNTMGVSVIACSGLVGFANSVRLELGVLTEFIDLEWNTSPKMISMLYTEIFCQQTFGYNNVRLLETGRYVQRVVSTKYYEMRDEPFELPDDGVILMTGGNGSLALVFGKYFLEKSQGSGKKFELQFLSRSCKITDDNMPTWKAIERLAKQQNITVSHVHCDISNPSDVEALFARNNGNISGIMHTAGVLQDGLIANQTREKFDRVFNPKCHAALMLHDACERYSMPKLKFFVMFSSVAAWGSSGQCNYSTANAFLDALARHRRARGLPGITVQWGGWGEVGMAANMDDLNRRRLSQGPFPFFTNKEALQGWEAGLRTGMPNFTCFKLNMNVLVAIAANIESKHHYFMPLDYSPVVPVAPPKKFGYKELAYPSYCAFREGMAPYTEYEQLTFDEFVRPYLDYQNKDVQGAYHSPKTLFKMGAKRRQT